MKRQIMKLISALMTASLALCLAPQTMAADTSKNNENQDKWTIMIYMCGSDLESVDGSATEDLEEIRNAEYPDSVNVLVETGGASKWFTDEISADHLQRWEIRNGEMIEKAKLDQASMGEADTLSSFISYAMDEYPAEKTMLIMWDHGGGSLGGIGSDENYDQDSLELDELKKALNDSLGASGKKLTMMGMDACMMASLEAAQIIRDHADYYVASEETEPGEGWYYTDFMNRIGEDPEIGAVELGKKIVDSYYEKSRQEKMNAMVTLSLIDLSKIPDLSASFEEFSDGMVALTQEPSTFRDITQSADSAENYGGNNRLEGYTDMIDLYGFARNAQYALGDASKAVEYAVDDAVLYERHGSQRAGANGISVVYPLIVDDEILESYARISDNVPYLEYLRIVNDSWDQTYQGEKDVPYAYGFNAVAQSLGMETEAFTPIQSADYPVTLSQTIDDQNILHVKVETGLEIIDSAVFSLTWQDPETGNYVLLGYDNNLDIDWEKGIFTDNFNGKWMSIDGRYVCAYLIEENEDYNLYSLPALVNGEKAFLRATYLWDEDRYEILGMIRDTNEGMSFIGKKISALKDGDEVQFAFEQETPEMEAAEEYYSDKIIWSDDLEMKDIDLVDGSYYYMITLFDFFENSYDSDPVCIEIANGTIELQEMQLPERDDTAETAAMTEREDTPEATETAGLIETE